MFGRLIDKARTIAGVRKERRVPAAGDKPAVGTSIIRDNLRIRLRYPIDEPFWMWLVSKGWRAMQAHGNRRRYTVVPDKYVVKLLKADLDTRDAAHDKLIERCTTD